MKPVALLLAFLLTLPIDACIWIKGTTKEGSSSRRSGFTPARRVKIQLQTSMATDLREEGKKTEESLRGSTSFDGRNDYAVALMYLGRADEAVALLQKLETEKPGDYSVAANLGTAYELSGQNELARKWIHEGLRRNPDSHFGTEWLHLAILDAKIQQQANPKYFDQHSVLNVDYRTLKTGALEMQIGDEKHRLHDLTEALRYQLVERLKFVKGKDPAVASLLFDYAAIEAGTATLESAISLLQLAAEYGYPATRIDPLIASYTQTIRISTWKSRAYSIAFLAALLAAIVYAVRRRLALKRENLALRATILYPN
jgi:tetratricopeptide (TPR) repeat protein